MRGETTGNGYARLGQTAKAAEALTRYGELEPAASITRLRCGLPFRNADQAERSLARRH